MLELRSFQLMCPGVLFLHYPLSSGGFLKVFFNPISFWCLSSWWLTHTLLCRAASQFHGSDWPWLFCLVCLPVLTFPGMLFRLLTIRRHGSAPWSQHLANSGMCWCVLASGVWMVPVLSWRLLRSRTNMDCPSIFRITEKSWQQKSRSWSGRSLELQMTSLVRVKLNKCHNLSCSM